MTEKQDHKPVVIDLEKSIASKNKRLAKSIPGFIMRYLKKTIHQEEMNEVLKKNRNVFGTQFVEALLKDFNITYTVHNAGRIPKEGRYIFASNHPLGGFDGVVLIDMITKNFAEPRVFVNDLLTVIKNYEPLFLPVNKHGGQQRDVFKIIDEACKSEYHILDFPFGLVSRKVKGKVMDLEWKKTFVNRARKYERDIIPVHFDSENTKRFYRVAKWRKRLGIKANIEMFYLPDESFRKRNHHFDIYLGEPISYKSLTKDKTPNEWAAEIKKIAYSLKPKA
jgi:putative hemolysin